MDSPTELLKIESQVKCYGGTQFTYSHFSAQLKCRMNFVLYVPSSTTGTNEKFHTLFFLAGLSSNEQTFVQKSGFQKYASAHKIMVLCPDTSPRVPPLIEEQQNLHGWYVDALNEPWVENYQFFSYVTKELPELVKSNFPTTGIYGVMGHSMGGHGAIVCGLTCPDTFKSISAFAPVCNPTQVPCGRGKAFKELLGVENMDTDVWNKYDSCELIKSYDGPFRHILVDQGSFDEFLKSNLTPNNLKEAAEKNKKKDFVLDLRIQEGYDHSYYFLSTFLADHFEHHIKYLIQCQY